MLHSLIKFLAYKGESSILVLNVLLTCSVILGATRHSDKGTEYGKNAVVAYAEFNHGPDGGLFLDPYIRPDLENLNNMRVLDAGCGAAPWSIYAAKQGGKVYAIDIQTSMLEAAKKAIEVAKLGDKINITLGDVAFLPYTESFFDKAISVCVGCNLPSKSLERHVLELQRTLKVEGIAIFAAPTSLDTVFTDGSRTDSEVYIQIQEILQALPENPSSDLISDELTQLTEVLSATFYIKKNRLALLDHESVVLEGEKVWRKLPRLVVPNFFYSKAHYMEIFKEANFNIKKLDSPHFTNEDERITYNNTAQMHSKLGQAYVLHAPFIIFHLTKSKE